MVAPAAMEMGVTPPHTMRSIYTVARLHAGVIYGHLSQECSY